MSKPKKRKLRFEDMPIMKKRKGLKTKRYNPAKQLRETPVDSKKSGTTAK